MPGRKQHESRSGLTERPPTPWAAGVVFTPEQASWLDKIAEHIATSLAIEMEDFHDGWFAQRGNLGKAYELFGDKLQTIITDMNRALTA